MSFSSETGAAARPDFLFLGGHPAIDFANTLLPPPGPGIEFLPDWNDVIDWLSQAHLAKKPGLSVPEMGADEALHKVRTLRYTWRNALAEIIEGHTVPADFVARLNASLAKDTFSEVLRIGNEREFRLVRSDSRLCGEHLALSILARQIACFLDAADLEHLRRCANLESCVLYFYDTTKNHRRRWCSVATCGNRHKVAEFRLRQRNLPRIGGADSADLFSKPSNRAKNGPV
jgi:predicted RNA-binding Zn ribbon-like protein